MNRQSIHVVLLVCIVSLFSGCGGGSGAAAGNGTGSGTSAGNGVLTAVTIAGQVTDPNGAALSGVTVSAATTTTATDQSGAYHLTIFTADQRITVNSRSSGYAPQVSVVLTKPSVTTYGLPITLYQTTNTTISNPASSTTATVTAMGRQTRITIPAGAVSGIPPFTLRIASFNPNSGPGILDSPNGALQSAGMFYIDVVDAIGKPATLAPGANIQIAMPPFLPATIPNAQPYQGWQLNGQNGQWAQPQQVAVPQSGMNLPAGGFGYWNFDRNYLTACVKGKLSTANGACSGGRVRADGPDGISSFDNSGSDGSFCVTGAQTLSSTLNVGSFSKTLAMPAQAGDCTAPQTCQDIGTVTIDSSQCSGSTSSQPQSQCGTATVAGGDAAETHVFSLGQSSGSFTFTYDTYSQPDQIVVTYEGHTLFDTGCVGASGSQTLNYSGNSTSVTVTVTPNCAGGSGTAWTFTVGCPN